MIQKKAKKAQYIFIYINCVPAEQKMESLCFQTREQSNINKN